MRRFSPIAFLVRKQSDEFTRHLWRFCWTVNRRREDGGSIEFLSIRHGYGMWSSAVLLVSLLYNIDTSNRY
ncbi:hypothetical protein BHE74_00025128 [Ensete ventricosum]|nr:hypothetical protein GW17_00012479 [Ensete ventricosum]RWW67426.1 hypothetical protein BHE74_00025128 [Ensete ventricosum]